MKGLLVIAMVYCHVLQFFADREAFPAAGLWIELANVLVFPGFMFVFGRTAWLAYMSRPFRQAWPRMLRQGLMLLGVFYVSGIGYRLLAENRPLRQRTVARILLLQDIPGWSEFLAAFAVASFLVMVGFALWKWLIDRPVWLAVACVLPVAASALIPYGSIGSTYAGLLIGGTQFAFFPVLLYWPFVLIGMYVQKNGFGKRWWAWLAGAAVVSLPAVIVTIGYGLPGRFPPTPFWLLLPVLGICLLALLSAWWTQRRTGWLEALPARVGRVLALPGHAIEQMGRLSLYYLLASNLAIFTFSGKGITPEISLKADIPWRLAIASPQGAACWTAILIGCIAITLMAAGVKRPRG